MMKLILLPGLDGTGELFEPFINELPATLDVETIAYPTEPTLSYNELLAYVEIQLPKEDFIIIAESFSGWIAYQIALQNFVHLRSIIFVATFLQPPKLLKFSKFFPLRLIASLSIPRIIIKHLLLGKKVEDHRITFFQQTIDKVPSNIIVFRLQEIAQLSLSQDISKLEVSYIKAIDDKLVESQCIAQFKACFARVMVDEVDGGHLILQANPQECAKIVMNRMRKSKIN